MSLPLYDKRGINVTESVCIETTYGKQARWISEFDHMKQVM